MKNKEKSLLTLLIFLVIVFGVAGLNAQPKDKEKTIHSDTTKPVLHNQFRDYIDWLQECEKIDTLKTKSK